MRHEPMNVDIGPPEENPGIVVEPIKDPVPRENPSPSPAPSRPVKVPKREPVPA